MQSGASERVGQADASQAEQDRRDWCIRTSFGGSAARFEAWRAILDGAADPRAEEELAGDVHAIVDRYDHAYRQGDPAVSALLEGLRGPSRAAAPFLFYARTVCAGHAGEPSPASPAVEALTTYLKARLTAIAAPSVAMSLNLERLAGRLPGETGSARADYFYEHLAEPAVRARVLGSFPILDRLLGQAALDAVDAWRDLMDALDDDRAELARLFQAPGPLTAMTFGLGDPHAAGRCVASITLGDRRIIYKPHGLAADAALAAITMWVNGRTSLDLPSLRILDRGRYGWVEFVEPAECASRAELETCFRRIGGLLAIAYVVGVSDVHGENIVCSGDRPYLIDQETLLFPDMRYADAASRLMARAQNDTVLRIGYLPHPYIAGGLVIDQSGAGGLRDQDGFETLRLSGLDSDSPAMAPTVGTLRHHKRNVPHLDGQARDARDHLPSLLDGFGRAYEAIRGGWAGKDPALKAIVAGFAGLTYRFVARPTTTYVRLLNGACHPRALASQNAFEHVFCSLAVEDGRTASVRTAIAAAELVDLNRHDVPIFHAVGRSRDLFDARGGRIANVFRCSGFETLKRRLHNLGEADLARQSHAIETAFLARSFAPPAPRPRQATALELIDAPDMADLALQIGEALRARAAIVDGLPVWTTTEKIDLTAARPIMTGLELYDGVGGVGVFLAELASTSGCSASLDMAGRCSKAVRLSPPRADAMRIGGFNGLGGRLYAVLRIAEHTGAFDIDWMGRALRHIGRAAAHDLSLDIVAGVAGAALVATACARHPELRDDALKAATACGRRLAATVHLSEDGAWWRPRALPEKLTGYSHGAAGMAAALASVAACTGDAAFFDLALRAVDYERSTFSQSRGWPDLRDCATQPADGMTWCHGAPGIGLSRRLMLDLPLPAAPPILLEDLDMACERVLSADLLPFDSLCHGALGALDFMCGLPGWHDRAAQKVARLAASVRRTEDWRLETPGAAPGLMTGLAGIGYALLRWREPSIPSVLGLSRRADGGLICGGEAQMGRW